MYTYFSISSFKDCYGFFLVLCVLQLYLSMFAAVFLFWILRGLGLQGGSSSKVVDCILCLKGYYEWKQAGGIGVWRYGGTVRITCFPKGSSSSLGGSESADESIDESDSSQFEQLLDFLHLSSEVSTQESRTAAALAFLFDRFGLGLLQAYLHETNGIDDFPLNAMVGKTLVVYMILLIFTY